VQQVLVTVDPATNALKIETNVATPEAVVFLLRAQRTLIEALARPVPAIEAPSPDQVRELAGARG
jgi:hypothetical protein